MAKNERNQDRKEEHRERRKDKRESKDSVHFPLPDHRGMHERENKPKAP